MAEQNIILSALSAQKKLRRMALQMAERNFGAESIIIIGIKENGIFIAEKIGEYLREVFPGSVTVVSLSLNKKEPREVSLSADISLTGKLVLLVDDVANSGRTMLYALRPLLEQYPAHVETLALVERTHKAFPLELNYVGLSVSTAANENIVVRVESGEVTGAETGNADQIAEMRSSFN